ncbi:MAG: hypothetical protein RDU89_04720 [bacterium]|nr:hypothetical protein [bacterium]
MRKRCTVAMLAVCLVAAAITACPGRRPPTLIGNGGPGPGEAGPAVESYHGGWRLGPFEQVVEVAWVSPGQLGYRARHGGGEELGRLGVLTGTADRALVVAEDCVYLGDPLPAELGCIYSVLSDLGNRTHYIRPDGTRQDFPAFFYRLSPSREQAVLFTSPPVLLEFMTGRSLILPDDLHHEWPAMAVGLRWSPCERLLLYEDWHNGSLVILRTLDGEEELRIEDEGWSSIEAAWSPDGRRIAFLSWRTGEPYAYRGDYDCRLTIGRRLGILCFEPGEISYLPGQPMVFGRPVWCPAGRRVAFAAGAEKPGGEIEYRVLSEIWVHDTVTGESSKVTSERSGIHGKQPVAWSPQGDRLLFVASSGDEWADWVVDLATGLETRVGTPDRAAWLPDGRLLQVVTVAGGVPGQALELLDSAGGVTRLLEAARIGGIVVIGNGWFGGEHVGLILEEEPGREFVVVLPL